MIDEDDSEIKLDFKNSVSLFSENKKLTSINSGSKAKVILSSKISFNINGNNFESDFFEIRSNSSDFIFLNNKKFRGKLILSRVKEKIGLINVLDFEEYLKGVLASEMGTKFDQSCFEALKAFAICARTFSVLKINQANQVYDLRGDVKDQVYDGAAHESTLNNSAIEETKGLILTYQGSIAKIFYHSSCGGTTENIGNVFSENNIPYLVSVNDGDNAYCKLSPNFNWKENYAHNKIVDFLFDKKLISSKDISIRDISIISKFPSNRIKEMTINIDDGKEIILTNKEIRNVFRRNDNGGILRSLMFDLEISKEGSKVSSLTFVGRGSGHGVGFCQWGAIGQSKDGKDFKSILEFYFPSTKISKMND